MTENTNAVWNDVQKTLSQYASVWDEPTYEGLITNRVPHTALLGNGDVGVASGGDAYSKNFYISKGDFWGYNDSPLPVGGVILQATKKAEPEVKPVSLAEGATVTASNYHDDYRPEHAVNGLVGPEYEGWVSKIGNPQWIEFDLHKITTFDRMSITHAEASKNGSSADNTKAFTVSARSNAEDEWQVIYETDSNQSAKTDVTFDEAVTARYIRIDVTKGTQETTSDSIQNPRARIAQFQLFDSSLLTDEDAGPVPTSTFREEQDILNARITTEMELGGVPVYMDTRMMADDNLLITALTSRGTEDVELIAQAWAKADNAAMRQTSSVNGSRATVTRTIPKAKANDPKSYTTMAALSTRIVGAEATASVSSAATADLTFTLPAGETVYVVTAIGGGGQTYDYQNRLTGAEPTAEAAALLDKAADADDIAALQQAHADWWKDYWMSSFVKLDDTDERLRLIQKYYYVAQYELGCNAREGEIAPGLHGIWHTTDTPSFHSDYHLNYNFIATFYGSAASNRVEQLLPAVEAITDFAQSENGQASAATIEKFRNKINQQVIRDFVDFKKADGSIDPVKGVEGGVLFPVGIGPWGMILDDTYWNQTYNAPFSAYPLIQYYEYTQDEEFMRDVLYPYLKPILTFLKAWVVENDEGTYDLYAGYNESSWAINSMGEVSMYRTCLRYAIMISEKLGIDADERAVWQELQDKFPTYPTMEYEGKTVYALAEQVYENGEWKPWYKAPQRLTLEPIFPAGEFGYYSTPEELEIMYNSMQFVDRDNWWKDGNAFPEVYTQALMVRYDPEIVVSNLAINLEKLLQANGMVDDGGHGVEKAGSIQSVNAMLLQADKGVVKVFPNWLKDKDASFVNLQAPGAFLLSASYSGKYREVESVTVTSKAGKTLTLASPWADAVITDSKGNVIDATPGTAPNHPEELTYTFATKAGETYTVSRGANSPIPVTPPSSSGHETTLVARFGNMVNREYTATKSTNLKQLYADWTGVDGNLPVDLTAYDPSKLRLRVTVDLHASDESAPASALFLDGWVKLRSPDVVGKEGDPNGKDNHEHNFGWNINASWGLHYGENVFDIPLEDALNGLYKSDNSTIYGANNKRGLMDWTQVNRLIFVINTPLGTPSSPYIDQTLTMRVTKAEIVNTTFEDDLARLQELIADTVEQGSYTDASYAAYEMALAQGEEVAANDQATVADVQNALDHLEDALAELTADPNAVLKATLRALVVKAEQMDPMITTPDWVERFDTALAQANTVLAGDNATQTAVDEALDALKQVIGELTVTYRAGDVDANGEVQANDALMALQAATGKISLSSTQRKAADVDGTAGVTANDALQILQYATKKITTFH